MHVYSPDFVDTTPILQEILSTDARVKLIPAPRMFGRNTTLSMLQDFLSPETDPAVFDTLKISRDRAFCKTWQGKYPVMKLELRSSCGIRLEDHCKRIAQHLLMSHPFLFCSRSKDPASGEEREIREELDARVRGEGGPLTPEQIPALAADMVRLLYRHCGQKVVLLIEEYDTPLNYSWEEPYFEDMLRLMRSFYTELLLDNDCVAFAVLTGFMRMAWEAIFPRGSGPSVWTPPGDFPAGLLCFRDGDVAALLKMDGVPEAFEDVKEWYGGYRYRGESRYSPWEASWYSMARSQDCAGRKPPLYRGRASHDAFLNALLKRTARRMRQDYRHLLRTGSIRKPVRAGMTYTDLKRADSVWTLWVASGYLTVLNRPDPSPDADCELGFPNRQARELAEEKLLEYIPSLAWKSPRFGIRSPEP